LHVRREIRAISPLILIILLLCSVIFGALIAYVWTMSNFYLEPNTIQLTITDVDFPVDHADYFNVTIMNPSHSASGTNVTQIYFTVQDNATVFNVVNTAPQELPFVLEKAAYVTIKCNYNWGEFAGKWITVHVSGNEAVGSVKTMQTPFVRLGLETFLNASISSKKFNVTVENSPQSEINLNVSSILIDREPITDLKTLNGTSIALPFNLTIGERIPIQCAYDWENKESPVIRVETSEGYYAEKAANVKARMSWFLTQAMCKETSPEEINITVFNSVASDTFVDINLITLTFANGSEYFINGSLTDPPIISSPETPYYRLDPNKTITFSHCIWNWRNYPDQNVTANVYNIQGFKAASRLITIPPSVIYVISGLDFNITSTGYFSINITNLPASTHEIGISKILINDNAVAFENQTIPIGEQRRFNCTYDWSSLRGQTIAITVNTTDGFTEYKAATLESVDLRISDAIAFNTTTEGTPYLNVTVLNTAFSTRNVTITQIVLATANSTYTVDGTTSPQLSPNGYLLVTDSNITIVCPWNWNRYTGESLTVTVRTTEGFTASQTFQIP
jgi:hypothetical protein